MNTCIYIRSAAAAVAILLLTQFLGCRCENEGTFWFTDPPEVFHTNDVERAQKEIPFIIILPTYIPDDIPSYPYMIEGPVRGTYPEDEIGIIVSYIANYVDGPTVYIKELNRVVVVYPPPNSEAIYLDVGGIQILEHKTSILEVSHSSGSENVPGFSYTWNRDEISFDVGVYRFDRDDARRIIESMIR